MILLISNGFNDFNVKFGAFSRPKALLQAKVLVRFLKFQRAIKMAITYNFYIILDTYKHKPLKCAQNVIPPRLSTTKCIFKSALPSTVIIVFSNTFFLERKYILNLKISFKKTYKNDKIMSFNLLLIIISW